jgi:hypothetical protein
MWCAAVVFSVRHVYRQNRFVGKGRMTKLIAARLAVCIVLLPIARAFAQDSAPSGPQTEPAQGQEMIASEALGFWCTISGDGHEWSVLSTNTTGRGYQCTINCAFRTGTGLVTNTSCTPAIESGLNRTRVCGGSNSSVAWTGLANNGTHSCR